MLLSFAATKWCLGTTIDIKDNGAKADGSSDDSAVINSAIRALPKEGGTVFFPPGIYSIGKQGIIIKRSNVTLRGAGSDESILRRIEQPGPLIQTASSGTVQENLVLKDLCFDGNRPALAGDNISSIALYGTHLSKVILAGCKFVNIPAVGLGLSGISDVQIDRCVFRAPGNAYGTAVSMTGSCHAISISRSRFLYVHDGLIIDTGSESNPTQYQSYGITIRNNYFDLGWWLLKPILSGEGPSVTYGEKALTDTKGTFKNLLSPRLQNIRVMPIEQKGQGLYTATRLKDVKAQFKSNRVKRGDIIRAKDLFAVVAEVQSESSLEIEEWLSDTDRSPGSVPEDQTPYTVYGVILGEVVTFNSHQLTTTRWWDFDGRSLTPAPGTHYEVLEERPNYALHAEAGAREILVADNQFRRGWSDQVSIWGERAVIKNNVIEDGEDMGITLHGKQHRVLNNRINRQGAGGIYLTADDCVVRENRITDSQWVNNVNELTLGDIIVEDGGHNSILANWCERLHSVLGYHGIVISARRRGSRGNVVMGNTSRNHLKADIRIEAFSGAEVTQTRLERNQGRILR